MEIVRELEETAWRAFVEQHPEGMIFHSPEMFRVFGRTKGCRPELWAAVEKRRIMALFLPVRIAWKGGALRPWTSRAVCFGGVLGYPGAEGNSALSFLLNAYAREIRHAVIFTEIRNRCDSGPIQPTLRREGFLFEDHLEYVIDLGRPLEAIFQSIGRRTRKHIKHGLNRGAVRVEEIHDRRRLGECYDLLAKTYRAAKVPLTDRSLFEAAFDLLYPRKMVRFALASVDGQPAAVSVELLYKKVLFGWYGGLDRRYSAFVPNELLMWDIFQWGAKNGCGRYEFGGAGKPNETYGVRDFKAKFGGALVNYGRNSRVHRPVLFNIGRTAYQLARRIFGKSTRGSSFWLQKTQKRASGKADNPLEEDVHS
jgi:serine/alanine adding enzyme